MNQFYLLWYKWKWQYEHWRDNNKTTTKKEMVLQVMSIDIGLSLSFLTDLLVLCFVRILFNTWIMNQYLQSNQVAQEVQILQDTKTTRTVEEIHGRQVVTWGALPIDLQQATGVQVYYQSVRTRLHECGRGAWHSLEGPVPTAQHHAAWLAFAREHHDWPVHHWWPLLFTDENRFTLSMWQKLNSLEM